MVDGDDLRKLPLSMSMSMRKANLARLLAHRPEGIFISDFEQGEIGLDLFRKACEFGLKALVSKHRRAVNGSQAKFREVAVAFRRVRRRWRYLLPKAAPK